MSYLPPCRCSSAGAADDPGLGSAYTLSGTTNGARYSRVSHLANISSSSYRLGERHPVRHDERRTILPGRHDLAVVPQRLRLADEGHLLPEAVGDVGQVAQRAGVVAVLGRGVEVLRLAAADGVEEAAPRA